MSGESNVAEVETKVKAPRERMFSKKNLRVLREPLSDNNPISFQVLGATRCHHPKEQISRRSVTW